MADHEEKVNVDRQGRICDKQGRPLRVRGGRREDAVGAHPRAAKLRERQESFDGWAKRTNHTTGRRRPGSQK